MNNQTFLIFQLSLIYNQLMHLITNIIEYTDLYINDFSYLLEMEMRLQAVQKDLKNDLQAAQTISEQRMVDSKKDLKNDLQAAQKDLKNDLKAAQTISEQRMLDSQKQQIYKIVFLGASVGFTAFVILKLE